ncbi:MAG TPA: hypothetical protein VGH73_03185 [Thermoanaerobaculia bacterium]|jgi:hypothetical protein
MRTSLRVAALASVLALAGVLAGSGNVHSRPQEIRFEKGRTSATLQGTLTPASGATTPQAYTLHARAGQVMTIRFAGLDQGASFSVICPHGGRLDAGRSSLWSTTLPVSGDYTVAVERKREGGTVPYALEVGVAGKAAPVPPRGVTGFYQFGKSGFPSLEALELPDGQVKFVFYAEGGGVMENGPARSREISGTVPLRNGTAVHQVEGCKRTMTFARNGVRVSEEGECGTKENGLAFDGAYRKVSPCANPVTMNDLGRS